MTRQVVGTAIALTLCLAVSFADAAPRGKEGGKSAERKPEGNETNGQPGKTTNERESGGRGKVEHGGSAPGGSWSEPTHHSGKSAGQPGRSETETNANATIGANAAGKNQTTQASGAQGAAAANAASKRKTPQASGAQGAAAGAAAANRNSPQVSGAQGAAAGAAAANRNSPQVSGAQGAAAGAAAANRNSPQISGAEGAAAGAAAANRNSPQISGAQGAAAGAAVANRNSPQVSGAEGAALGSAAVRNSFDNPNLYSRQWYDAHQGVWAPSGWAAGAAWTPTNWGAVSSYCGANNAPVSYNYGTNVTCQDGNVMMNGQSVGTAAQFSQQAADLAQTGAAAETSASDDWLPLGVFAMVRNEQQHPQLILQLAINKQGILRGNYTDEVTEHTQPIHGAVDPQTQRAAWIVGNNTNSVMEAGLSNLAAGEAPALIHKSGKTDHWLLVRLDRSGQE